MLILGENQDGLTNPLFKIKQNNIGGHVRMLYPCWLYNEPIIKVQLSVTFAFTSRRKFIRGFKENYLKEYFTDLEKLNLV